MLAPHAQIWVEMPGFSVAEMSLKAASEINNLEDFVANIMPFKVLLT
jgi:hypothetical protein